MEYEKCLKQLLQQVHEAIESCAPWCTDWLEDNICEGFNLKRYKSDY
jgi:hypothetical protein